MALSPSTAPTANDAIPWTMTKGVNAEIASRSNGERMGIEAMGRNHFQHVHLWALPDSELRKNSRVNSYDANFDLPNDLGSCPKIASGNELISNLETKEYLEVGLIIGTNPKEFMVTGKSRNKEAETERKERGIMPRHASALRVFIPVTEYKTSQAKLYVGCHLTNGRMFPRTATFAQVFFYPEF